MPTNGKARIKVKQSKNWPFYKKQIKVKLHSKEKREIEIYTANSFLSANNLTILMEREERKNVVTPF